MGTDEAIQDTGESAPELSILLVNWNTREMTLECLRSIVRETGQTSYEIILVDNGSSDGSAEAIAQEFPQVRLIELEENLGFARATNLQAKEARGAKLLLLNTDTVVLDHAIDRLVDFSRQHPDARIWGGRTLFADGSLNPTSCWGRPTGWNIFAQFVGLSALFPGSPLFNPRAYPGWMRDSDREVDIVTGCLFMIGRRFWEELGGFDPQFFMFGEEADLCLRAHGRGARPMVTPAATIIHYDGGSSRSLVNGRVHLLGSTIGLASRHMGIPERQLARLSVIYGVWLRRTAFAIADRVLPERFADKRDLWAEIWRRRKEWRDGPMGQGPLP